MRARFGFHTVLAALVGSAVLIGGCAYDLTDAVQGQSAADTSASGSSDAGSGRGQDVCNPGEAAFCGCADGTLGVQLCSSEGTFLACDCTALNGGGGSGGNGGGGGTADMGADIGGGSADTGVGSPDLGSPDADFGVPDAVIAWEPTCTSNRHWFNEEDEPGEIEGDDDMTPGRACVSCHEREREGPRLELGGTVFPAYHDEDDCYGVSGVTVRVFGADGSTYTFRTNRSGNFYARSRDIQVALPYTAEVEYNGATWAMETPQTNLDCNTCHSVAGSEGAAGRIVIP